MTWLALVAEESGYVIRICGSFKIGSMALVTIRVDDLIISADMAREALGECVSAGQRKLRRCMIERRRMPAGRRMACLAGMVEISGEMVWICRRFKISLVALVAVRVCESVVPVRMARLAFERSVFTRQRESSRPVVEC